MGESFALRYQTHCDQTYWQVGQCCAGCDHWQSEMGNMGRCLAAPVVSGADVMRSLNISSSSWPFAPGHPFTRLTDHCGAFKDDFDWSGLDELYLRRIGATFKGKLLPKPTTPPHG